MELRVYEKHFLGVQRVGTVEYAVSTVVNQAEASFSEAPVLSYEVSMRLCSSTNLDLDTKKFKATLSFPTPDVVSISGM